MTVQTDSVKKPESTSAESSTEKVDPQIKNPAKKIATKSTDQAVIKPKGLLLEVMEARELWLAIIEENNIGKKAYRNKSSKRSQQKILYFIPPVTPWGPKMRKEIDELKTKLSDYKEKKKSISRSLWLPTVIRNAQRITVRIYEARASRKVSFETAKKFAQKAGVTAKILNEMTENQEFRIDYFTGRKYKLSVLRGSGTKEYSFTEWAICVCTGGNVPKYNREDVEYTPRKDNSKKLICEHNKSSLFVKVSKVT